MNNIISNCVRAQVKNLSEIRSYVSGDLASDYSVTEVLKGSKAKVVPNAIMERGTKIHEEFGDDPIFGYILRNIEHLEKVESILTIQHELPLLASVKDNPLNKLGLNNNEQNKKELLIGGTPDFIFEHEKGYCVLELKTGVSKKDIMGNKLALSEHGVQCCAYAAMYASYIGCQPEEISCYIYYYDLQHLVIISPENRQKNIGRFFKKVWNLMPRSGDTDELIEVLKIEQELNAQKRELEKKKKELLVGLQPGIYKDIKLSAVDRITKYLPPEYEHLYEFKSSTYELVSLKSEVQA